MKTFKFLQKNKIEPLTFVQPRRYPRTPISQIPYPESCETPEEKRTFRRGWRACEQGREIYDNPYSNREELIYSLHRAWESGYLECYLHHPTRTPSYLTGWEQAQRGYPINTNPWGEGTDQHNMFNLGWRDFINTH